MRQADLPPWAMPAIVLAERLVFGLGAAGLGLYLARRIGHRATRIETLLENDPAGGKLLLTDMKVGMLLGAASGVAVLVLAGILTPVLWPELAESQKLQAMQSISLWKAALVSFSAGVIEEAEFRLGLMTLCAWFLATLVRNDRPGPVIVWTSNVLAVVPFGLIHLLNVVGMGIPITLGSVVLVTILNGFIGLLFGWLYWRRGIEAAMAAHFAADIVLKVIAPLIQG
jgi:hypothetical protein